MTRTCEVVALGPRVSGTKGAEIAATFLAYVFDAVGCTALVDTFDDPAPGGPVRFRNVLGVLPPARVDSIDDVLKAREGPIIVIGSHYDTKEGISAGFIGANDSGSSTGLLLHLASLYARQPPEGVTLLFACFDGEECRENYRENDGLHGSKRLARQLQPFASRVRGVIILDMIGDRSLNVAIPANADPGLLSLALESARDEDLRQYFSLSRQFMIDDHLPFLNAGLPAIDLIDFTFGSAPGLNDYWHTPEDTLDKLSAASLEIVGRVTVRMVNTLIEGRTP